MGEVVLICGGRDFTNVRFIEAMLTKELGGRELDYVVTGGARGADATADKVCEMNGVQRVIVPANWAGRGIKAGMERNALMLKLFPVTLVIAFPGGVGTAGMVRLARTQGIFTIEYVNTLSEPYRA